MLPAAADLPWTVTLAAEEFQDHAAGAEQGPFANFDLVQARWRADLDRIFLVSELADQLRDGTVDTSAGAGGVLAVQVSASYFDDAAGASRAMAILESASAEALAGLPGTAGLPLELTEFAIAVGDASRGITFTSPPGTLAVPLPVRTDVVAFQRGRILVGVVIFAVAPADPGAAVVARMLDARISSGLARLPAGEPEPQDAEQRAARTALEQAQARWQDAGLADYQFRFVRYCECPAAWGGPFDVTVAGGRVVAFQREGEAMDVAAATTVPQLFRDIAATIDSGKLVVVAYDATLGYPTVVRLDLDAIPVDGGMALDILTFSS